MREEARLEKIEKNIRMAEEYFPELYLPVCDLYINVRVGTKDFQVLIDTGATNTYMSIRCAEECGISDLMDI